MVRYKNTLTSDLPGGILEVALGRGPEVARIPDVAALGLPSTQRNQVDCRQGIPTGWELVPLRPDGTTDTPAGADAMIETGQMLPALLGFEAIPEGIRHTTSRGGLWRKNAHYRPVTRWIRRS